MRRDWDARAAEDARRYIYTRDAASDVAGFDASGRANYDQLLRPYLPVLLAGRAARSACVAEIGCGVGRMTRWLAGAFGEVHAVDVSPAMLEQARARLAACPNVRLHLGSGYDLAGIPDAACDLVFSYIVFQHIPSRDAIAAYVRDAARVLRPGGVFKFQLNGDQSPAFRAHQPDTWLGETFSIEEAAAMLHGAGFSLVMVEGPGTQYFVLTARKGPAEDTPGPRPYILPGEPWAAAQLLEGWGEPADRSWRRAAPATRTRLAVPPGAARLFLGLYFWPSDEHPRHRIEATLGNAALGAAVTEGPGDGYVEWSVPEPREGETELRLAIAPPCPPALAPAVRCLGLYRPR